MFKKFKWIIVDFFNDVMPVSRKMNKYILTPENHFLDDKNSIVFIARINFY